MCICFLDPHPLVTPYAASSPDWLERIIASHNYEIMENEVDEDVPVTCQRVPYINIAPNRSLKVPPYLRNIFLEFERYYENTRYQRLKRYVMTNQQRYDTPLSSREVS